MKEILIATNNNGKKKDFETLFKPLGIKVLTLNDIDKPINVEETGITFEENAILKAETVASLLGIVVIADDSGLEIDALNGEPGVYSARYAGSDCDDEANIDKVLEKLGNLALEERTGRFRCVLAIAGPSIKTITFSGSCEGLVLDKRKGTNGFGYDPIFFVPEKNATMSELLPEDKSAISHRGAALRKLQLDMPSLLTEMSE